MPRHRLLFIGLMPATLIVFGAIGYWLIEGWAFDESLYMAVITLTTIGFSEVHPLSSGGRLFTISLALGGVFTVFFAASEILHASATGELTQILRNRSMKKKLSALHDHVILCGFGRVGRQVAEEFAQAKAPFVVVDTNEDLAESAELDQKAAVFLHGDATHDETLQRAGVDRARALVAATGSDADNVFITMTAHLLNDKLDIVARADNEQSVIKLKRAGAHRVVAPHHLSGVRVAQAVLRPNVLDFIEVATGRENLELELEEIVVQPGSTLAGCSVKDSRLRTDLELIVVAVKRADHTMVFNPAADVTLNAQDTLIVLGPRDRMNEAESMAASA